MANSLGQLGATLLANEIATVLESKFPILSKFCVNYTENIPAQFGYGSTLIVKNLSNPTVSKYNANGPNTGFAVATASASDISITVNQYASSKVQFDDTQLSSPVAGLYVEKFAERTSYAISKQILTDVIANVSSSNFTTSQSFASSSAAGRSTLVQSGQILDNAGVADGDRIVVVNPYYYNSGFLSDPQLYAPLNFNVNSNLNVTADFVHALNFDLAKADATVFPTGNYTTGTSGSLVGFACHPSALAFVTAMIPNPADFLVSGGNIQDFGVAISPRSGIQVAVVKYYVPVSNQLFIETRVMYGSTAGVPQALSAYVSQTTNFVS